MTIFSFHRKNITVVSVNFFKLRKIYFEKIGLLKVKLPSSVSINVVIDIVISHFYRNKIIQFYNRFLYIYEKYINTNWIEFR